MVARVAVTDTPLALVTGASTGIGRALAHEFVEHGFDVVVVADEGRIHDAAADLSTGGRQAIPVQADLATSPTHSPRRSWPG
jgi:uncharacterized protein